MYDIENDKGHQTARSSIYRRSNFPKGIYWLKVSFALAPDVVRNEICYNHVRREIMVKILMLTLFIAGYCYSKSEINFFGPRAGVGYLVEEKPTRLKEGVHSGFGWQVEVPYRSDQFVGYGEAGFMVLGVEQGIFYPSAWGFFGMRYNNFGIGLGPVINPMGVGIGGGPYYQVELSKIRIPIGVNAEFIDGTIRLQSIVGFSIK